MTFSLFFPVQSFCHSSTFPLAAAIAFPIASSTAFEVCVAPVETSTFKDCSSITYSGILVNAASDTASVSSSFVTITFVNIPLRKDADTVT